MALFTEIIARKNQNISPPLFLSLLLVLSFCQRKCITVVFGVGLCYNVNRFYDFSANCYAVSACYGVNLCYDFSTCFSVSLRVMVLAHDMLLAGA